MSTELAYDDVYMEIVDTVDVGTTGWFHCSHCRHETLFFFPSREKSLTGRSTLTSLPGEHPKPIPVPGWSAFVSSARPELGCDQPLKLGSKVSWLTVPWKPSWESNTPNGTTERDTAATTVKPGHPGFTLLEGFGTLRCNRWPATTA